MREKKYICPVCGFDGLKEPPYGESNIPSYEICPCCGFEFGFDVADGREAFAVFRNRWLANGAPWFLAKVKREKWVVEKQLGNLNREKA